MDDKWHDWSTFSEADDLRLLGWVPGVYAIRLLYTSNERPVSIGRFLGFDRDGILQIGTSKHLGKRLLDFFNSYYNGQHSHSEGERLCLVRLLTKFETHIYPEACLQYNMKWAPDIEHAQKEEERLLKSYFKQFGELPPLNSNIGNQCIRWTEMNIEWDSLW
jgi:hypothetical protein